MTQLFLLCAGTVHLRDSEGFTDQDFSLFVAFKDRFMLYVTRAFHSLKHAYVIG